MKPPTKAAFKSVLENEIQSWKLKADSYEGNLKEQAIGRVMECEWLLSIFEGKEKIITK